MARETINGISVPIPGTGEPPDFVSDLRRIATDLPDSFGPGGTEGNLSTAQAAATARTEARTQAPMVIQRVGFGGDSNTAYNGGNNWTAMLVALGKGKATFRGRWATGGYTIENWRDTHLPQVLATTGRDRPHAIVLMLGTNNVGETIATKIATYLNDIITPLRDAGIMPMLCTIPPRTTSTDHKTWTELFNAAVVKLASDQQLPLLDVYGALVDAATGDWKAGYNSDGIDGSSPGGGVHFFVTAAQIAVAKYVRSAFLAALRGPGVRWPQTNVSAANAETNALMLLGGGTFNGSANNANYAKGWVSNSGLTIASGAPALISDAYGTWQRIKDIDTTFVRGQRLNIPVTAGKRYQVLLKLRPDGFGGDAAGFYAAAEWYTAQSGSVISTIPGNALGSSGSTWYGDDMIDNATDDFLAATWEGVAPATATVIRLTVGIVGGGATLVGKGIDYGSLNVVDVT